MGVLAATPRKVRKRRDLVMRRARLHALGACGER